MSYSQRSMLVLAAACALGPASAQDEPCIYDVGAASPDLSTLVAAVDAAGLADALCDAEALTLFAPPNSAFEALPAGLVTKLLEPTWKPQLTDLLAYHLLPAEVLSTDLTDGLTATTLNSEDVTINLDPARVNEDSLILDVDIAASNGVIHTVDAVLAPTSVTSNIVQIGEANTDFSTLVAAVGAAGLATTLSGEGPFTLFAPTNEAFANLPEGTLDYLLAPENQDTLAGILQYHVVSGNIPASAVTTSHVPTLQGEDLSIVVNEGIKINGDANVILGDVLANNGIIHVIDAVLVPPTPPTSKSSKLSKSFKKSKSSSSSLPSSSSSSSSSSFSSSSPSKSKAESKSMKHGKSSKSKSAKKY